MHCGADRQDDAAGGKHMRSHGCENHQLRLRHRDGTARRQVICRRARRCGDDHAVGAVLGDHASVDEQLEARHIRPNLGEHDIIERYITIFPSGMMHRAVQHRAALHSIYVQQQLHERFFYIVIASQLCQISKISHIDAQQRYIRALQVAGGLDDRAVAAEDEYALGILRDRSRVGILKLMPALCVAGHDGFGIDAVPLHRSGRVAGCGGAGGGAGAGIRRGCDFLNGTRLYDISL